MNVLLWLLQILLAAAYVVHGWLFLTAPAESQQLLGLSRPVMMAIGALEWLGAAGLVLPGLVRVMRWLTPLAALGLAAIMAGAVIFDLIDGELGFAALAAVLLVLLAIVAYGRRQPLWDPARQTQADAGAETGVGVGSAPR